VLHTEGGFAAKKKKKWRGEREVIIPKGCLFVHIALRDRFSEDSFSVPKSAGALGLEIVWKFDG
jgi:hypothetical protein